MTDILERLKNPQRVYEEDDFEYGIYENAAKEIERLRAIIVAGLGEKFLPTDDRMR